MKLDVTEDGHMVAEEVYNPLILITKEGLDMAVVMRDNGFEVAICFAKDGTDKVKRYAVSYESIEEQ